MTTASSSPNIADLWLEARAWLADALRAFRGAAAIAETLARTARASIRARLLLIESFVMKLLLIEAARLHQAPHPFPGRRAAASPGPINAVARERGATKAAHRFHTIVSMGPGLGAPRQSGNGWAEDRADPSTWRVRFRLRIPRDRTRNPTGGRPAHVSPNANTHAAEANARALARRFEALRRMLDDPRRAIAALARKLATLGAAARAVASRIALARGPRSERAGVLFAHAMVMGNDARFNFPGDTS